MDLAHVAKVSDHARQLPKELHKQIIRNIKKRKVHSTFIDNIWGADLADIQLISKLIDKKFK